MQLFPPVEVVPPDSPLGGVSSGQRILLDHLKYQQLNQYFAYIFILCILTNNLKSPPEVGDKSSPDFVIEHHMADEDQ